MDQVTAIEFDDGLDEPATGARNDGPESRTEERTDGATGIPRVSAFETVSPHDIGDTQFDPGTPDSYIPGNEPGTGAGDRPKRRGRPLGSTNRAKTAETIPNHLINGLESILISLHVMGAAILSAPEWELEKDEAKTLAGAINEVGKHYNLMIDPKTMAITNLCMVAGGIYAPRLLMTFRGPKKSGGPQLVKDVPKKDPPQEQPKNGAIAPFELQEIFRPVHDE